MAMKPSKPKTPAKKPKKAGFAPSSRGPKKSPPGYGKRK